jgi:hypothetical protein
MGQGAMGQWGQSVSKIKPELGLINPEIGLNRLSNGAVSNPGTGVRTGKRTIQSAVPYPIDHSKTK